MNNQNKKSKETTQLPGFIKYYMTPIYGILCYSAIPKAIESFNKLQTSGYDTQGSDLLPTLFWSAGSFTAAGLTMMCVMEGIDKIIKYKQKNQ